MEKCSVSVVLIYHDGWHCPLTSTTRSVLEKFLWAVYICESRLTILYN